MPLAAHHVIARGDVLWRATLDGVLVRVPGADEVVKLAGTGAAVWAELDGDTRFDDLCERLAARHQTEPARVADDLRPVLVDLADRTVVRIDG